MKPSVGRIVHFYPEGTTGPYAGIVTGVCVDDDMRVSLVTFGAGGSMYFHTRVPFDDKHTVSNSWDWPPRNG